MKVFENYHPIVLFIYFISVLVIAMFETNPVILGLTLLGEVLFALLLVEKKRFVKDLVMILPFMLLVALTNPLFSHNGVTPLFFLNGNAVTLEAILYGIDIAAMIMAVIYWFKCYQEVFGSDKFLYLFGKIIPKVALVISMTLRFIPLLRRQYKKIADAQKCLGMYEDKSIIDKAKVVMKNVSILITWSLENSVDTSMSMKARGYGIKGRTNYHNFKIHKMDKILLIITLLMDVTVFTGMITGNTTFWFYPEITAIKTTPLAFTSYLAHAVLSFTPFIIELKENLKWKYYVWKI